MLAHELGHIKAHDVEKSLYAKTIQLVKVIIQYAPLVVFKLLRMREFNAELFAAKLVGTSSVIGLFDDLNNR